jgi:hypothetical protein
MHMTTYYGGAGIAQSVWREDTNWKAGVGLTSKPALGPTHPPIQWVPGALSLEVKRPGHEGNHLPPSILGSIMVELYLHSVIFLVDLVLNQAEGYLYFYL